MSFIRAKKGISRLCLATGLVLMFLFTSSAVQAQVFDLVVAKDGSSRYSTIQSALDKVPMNSSERSLIFVKNGLYKEKVWLYATKKNVSIIGESVEGVVISWDDYSGKSAGMSTANSYTFLAEGDDFYAENLTIENTAGNVGQAVALRTTGDRQIFKNCRFIGFQDTYYAHKNRQYNVNCYVEGATDFIFGDATAVFENSTINCVKGGQYITAPNDTKLISTTEASEFFYHGLLFINSDITADADVPDNSYYLGRPWGAPASSVFINCTLGSHIKEAGWAEWGEGKHLNGTFAEFENKDAEGNLINTSQRVDWSSQLSSKEVAENYKLDYFLRKNEVVWDPVSSTEALEAPAALSFLSNELSWQEVNGAKGYLIMRNGAVAGFSDTNTFEDTAAAPGIEYSYELRTVNANGNLSAASEALIAETTITGVKIPTNIHFEVSLTGTSLRTSEKVNVKVYSLQGSILIKEDDTTEVALDAVGHGFFLITLVHKNGAAVVKKVLL